MRALLTIALVMLVLSSFLYFSYTGDDNGANLSSTIVDTTLYVTTYNRSGNTFSTKNLLQFRTLTNKSDVGAVTISIDLNGDGVFSEDEIYIDKYPLEIREKQNHGYYTSRNTVLTDGILALVTIDDTSYTLTTAVQKIDINEILFAQRTLQPALSMKGVTYAEERPYYEIQHVGIISYPDLNQEQAECAPVVATNNIFALHSAHANNGNLPSKAEVVNELKQEMHWNRTDGVIPKNYITGIENWSKKYNLPITVTQIGDEYGSSTLDAIRNAINTGHPVSLRTAFYEKENVVQAGGHLVSVLGIYKNSHNETFIQVHDPFTSEGSEYIKIEGTTLVDYAPWAGETKLGLAFEHIWGTATSP